VVEDPVDRQRPILHEPKHSNASRYVLLAQC
jgi:hypothetical protein